MYSNLLRSIEHKLRMMKDYPSQSTVLLLLLRPDKGGFVKGGGSTSSPVCERYQHVAAALPVQSSLQTTPGMSALGTSMQPWSCMTSMLLVLSNHAFGSHIYNCVHGYQL